MESRVPIVSVVVLLCAVVSVNSVKWINCPGVTPKGVVSDVKIPGCETTPVCILKKGTNASIEIDFKSGEDTKTAKSEVHGIIAGISIPFPLDNPDVCNGCGVTCPLLSGSLYTYKTHIEVKSGYPSVSVMVKWEIKDSDGNDIVCIELPAKISSDNRTPKSRGNDVYFRGRQQL
jgi:Niemann-Pick C2 protein